MLTLSIGASTDVGLRRSLNEDALFVGSKVLAVADGMGGHAAGDVASAIAVRWVGELEARDELRPSDIRDVLNSANDDIVQHATAHPDCAGMGTTVAGIAVVTISGSDHWAVFNIGDSRVYRHVDGVTRQATTDHSEVAELVAEGRITPAEARLHPMRNIITRSLGVDPAQTVDLWVLPPSPGERYLVCSDGLTTEVDDAQVSVVLATVDDPVEAARQLVALANEAGGRDNVTVVVVHVDPTQAGDAAEDITRPRGELVGQGGPE